MHSWMVIFRSPISGPASPPLPSPQSRAAEELMPDSPSNLTHQSQYAQPKEEKESKAELSHILGNGIPGPTQRYRAKSELLHALRTQTTSYDRGESSAFTASFIYWSPVSPPSLAQASTEPVAGLVVRRTSGIVSVIASAEVLQSSEYRPSVPFDLA
jgi:hypothetical protein